MNCALYYTTPCELWTLSDDHYYGVIKGRLFGLPKNPTGASKGERNHKAAKRIHSRSRARLGKYKIETGTAILFNSKQIDRQIATTRMRMVVVVALMNLITLTYPRASMTCMTRISLRPRR